MNTEKTGNMFLSLAKIISVIFHPLFIPLYGLAVIFSAPTFLGYLPPAVKKILFFIVLSNNILIPLVLLPLLRNRNIITSYNIENRSERIIPLVVISVLYAFTSYVIFRFQIPLFIKSFILAATFVTMVVTVINFWWKISIHSVAVGALTAMVFVMSVKMYVPLTWYLAGVILSSGGVLSARLKLGSHNPPQVWVGYFTGLIGLSGSMLII